MKRLQKKILREDKLIKRKGYYLYLLHQKGIGEILKKYVDRALEITSSALMSVTDKEKGFNQLYSSRALHTLRDNLDYLFQHAAEEMGHYWVQKRVLFDIFGRVSIGYLDRKASPPWSKSKLDLSSKLSRDDERDPGKGHFKYFLNRMVANIMTQIQRGALNEETPNQIFKRVKDMFNNTARKGIREAKYDAYTDDLRADDENMALYGPVDIETGFYTADILTILRQEMLDVNVLEYRQYRPWFSDELLANNKALYGLEQQMYSDYVNLFNSGMNESTPDLNGIDDLEWSIQRIPGVKLCDYCEARDGLTMKEIKEKVNDEYGDKVPSLHPNCYCELIPRINDVWSKSDISNQGVEWDSDTGDITIPKELKNKLRLDLNLDEFMSFLSQGGGK